MGNILTLFIETKTYIFMFERTESMLLFIQRLQELKHDEIIY